MMCAGQCAGDVWLPVWHLDAISGSVSMGVNAGVAACGFVYWFGLDAIRWCVTKLTLAALHLASAVTAKAAFWVVCVLKGAGVAALPDGCV
jgi:hypothetical protein